MTPEMEEQVFDCQMRLMAAMVGFPTEIILAALTGVTGALIGQNLSNAVAIQNMVKHVSQGMLIVAEGAMNSEAVHVQ